jgi:hypothetical protein
MFVIPARGSCPNNSLLPWKPTPNSSNSKYISPMVISITFEVPEEFPRSSREVPEEFPEK